MLISAPGGRLRDYQELEHIRGMTTHQVITTLCREGGRPDLSRITLGVDESLREHAAGAGKLTATRAAVASLVACYFHWFWRPDWRLVTIGRLRDEPHPDLIWRRRDECVVIDEIKTSPWTGLSRQLQEQLEGYVALGRDRLGEEVGGVRLCPLRAPRRAALFTGPNKWEEIW